MSILNIFSSGGTHLVLRDRVSHGGPVADHTATLGICQFAFPQWENYRHMLPCSTFSGSCGLNPGPRVCEANALLIELFPQLQNFAIFFLPSEFAHWFLQNIISIFFYFYFLEWFPTASLYAAEQKDGTSGSEMRILNIRNKTQTSFLSSSLL